MEVEFTKEKLTAMQKISSEVISDRGIRIGQTAEDYMFDELTVQLEGYIYSNLAEERDLVYTVNRPKFLDWLLRRKRTVTFKLQVKDLLLKPPAMPNKTARIYLTNDTAII